MICRYLFTFYASDTVTGHDPQWVVLRSLFNVCVSRSNNVIVKNNTNIPKGNKFRCDFCEKRAGVPI